MSLKGLDLHLTNDCTLRCHHCVFSSGDRRLPIMSPDIISRLIDEFASVTDGKGVMNLFGGEVLLCSDLLQIIGQIREAGLSAGITTNCQVPDRIIEAVLSANIARFTSDLDGATAATHDALRNRRGNFDRVRRALSSSVGHGVFTTVNTVLHTANIGQVDDVMELCAELGVDGLAFYYLTPTGRGTTIADQCIDAETWIKIKSRVQDWIRLNTPSFVVCWEEAYEPTGTLTDIPWRCEKSHTETVFVRCDGEVYGCALLEGSSCSFGNVNEDDLPTILARRSTMAFDHPIGCPALSFHTFQDLSQPDPRTCPDHLQLGCPYNYQLLNG